MSYRKANKFAFDEERKEKFTERLKSLIGSRSVRAAAKEWGLSFSTLNNYLSRGTEPSFVAMQAIAAKEHVTLDWLAFGESPCDSNLNHQLVIDETRQEVSDPAKSTWNMIFDTLSPQEQKKILDFCLKEGARSMVFLVANAADVDKTLMALSLEEKERVIRLYEQIKKGTFEADSSIAEEGPLSCSKKAV